MVMLVTLSNGALQEQDFNISGSSATTSTPSQGLQAGRYVAGRYYDNSICGVNNSIFNYTSAVNGVLRSPFTSNKNITIDQLGLFYNTTSGSIKFAILSANVVTGWPDQVLWESAPQIITSVGFKAATISPTITLTANTTYWLQVNNSASCTIAMLVSGFPVFSALTTNGGQNAWHGMLRTTATFTDPTAAAYVGNTDPLVAETLPNAIRFLMRAV